MFSCTVDKQKPVVAPLVCSIFDEVLNIFFCGLETGFLMLLDKHPKELLGSLVALAAVGKGSQTDWTAIHHFNDVDRMLFNLHVIPSTL